MRKFFGVIVLLLVLQGCSSGVKLDEAQVEDKAGKSSLSGLENKNSARDKIVQLDRSNNTDVNKDAGPNLATKIIYFDYDSAVIRPEFQTVIEAHTKYLKADKTRRVVIEGHTDERGGREYNLALGQSRAEAVRRSMALLGLPDSQVEAVSFGKEKPAVLGGSEIAMEKNRRAEISYR
jgi:peptidoglycan-associated lipoprotein